MYPTHILLSSYRSGSTFLHENVNELENPYDDHNYNRRGRYRKYINGYPNFCLFRFHFDAPKVGCDPGFIPAMKKIIPAAKKVIILQLDVRGIVLSQIVRRSSGTRYSEEHVQNFNVSLEHFEQRFHELQERLLEWRDWIYTLAGTTPLEITWYDLKVSARGTVKRMSKYLGIPLSVKDSIDKWDETDFSLLPNIEEIYQII